MVRDEDGAVHVVENRCAHRGVAFCRERHGNVKRFVCPYHQWNYKLDGDLVGLPFQDGVRRTGRVNGGMPADFDPAQHGLTKLQVARRGGVVFATFDARRRAVRGLPGPGRSCPGSTASSMAASSSCSATTASASRRNWKLMQENIKDPYHPGLLHTWFVTFGLWRADQKSQMVMDRRHRHAVMISRRNDGEPERAAATEGVTSFKARHAAQ